MLSLPKSLYLPAAAFLLWTGCAVAGPTSGDGGPPVVTCTAGKTVTTSTPYTVCTPVTTTTDLGYNRCDVGGDRSTNSGDFAMGGDCSEATQSATTENCTVAYNTTTTTLPGTCSSGGGGGSKPGSSGD